MTEFLRTFSTTWAPETAGMGGKREPAASERCFACVRVRTSFVSVRFSCSARDNV